MRPRLSLVIPCFNQGHRLASLVERCVDLVRQEDAEVILVENGSKDDSGDRLTELARPHDRLRVVMLRSHAGYGGGILAGLRAARGSVLGWSEAEMQTDPRSSLEALPFFDVEPQAFVKGLRAGRPMHDVVFSLGMTAFEFAALRALMWDINAQPTLCSREFFESWEDPPDDLSLDLYAFHQALRQGLPVCRFPVAFDASVNGKREHNLLMSKLSASRSTVAFSLNLRQRLRSAR